MTMTEKILANHSDNGSVKPGDNIWTRVDKLLTHDVCGPGTFGIFQKEFGPNAKASGWACATAPHDAWIYDMDPLRPRMCHSGHTYLHMASWQGLVVGQ